MKAPNALKRVGRSIGVIRTKVHATMRRSYTGRFLKKDDTEALDERDELPTEKPQHHHIINNVEENDPSDFLMMMRSGSTSMEDIGIDNFDRALTVIENEKPEEISLPPCIGESKENMIQSPPHVNENPMTFADDDIFTTLDVAASRMVRSMSNLASQTYSKLVEEAHATVQDLTGAGPKEGDPENTRTTDEKGVPVEFVDDTSTPETRDSPSLAVEAEPKDDSSNLQQQEESKESNTTNETELKVEVGSARPIQTPKATIVDNDGDEDITVSTLGPDVILPPTVQNKSDSISGRAPDKIPTRRSIFVKALTDFGNRICRYQGEDPSMLRMFDAVRDILCCPDDVVDPTRPLPRATKSRSSLLAKEEDISVQDNDLAIDDEDVSQCTGPDNEEQKTVDSFDEIAQATILVSDMIKVQGSFTSEQCDQVERALKVLEEKAKKIGVNESDLLAAMASSDDNESRYP